MTTDHMYIHLQFNYDDIKEAEEAKRDLKRTAKEKFSHLNLRIYRKGTQVRFGLPYNGFYTIVKNYAENPNENKNPMEVIENFIDDFDACLDCNDVEVSFYWHVNYGDDD